MPLIAVAAIPTVASFLLRMGATKAARKYAPKLLKQARAYIKKNKLILSGNKVIKPKKGSIKTVRPTNKKTTKKKTSEKKTDSVKPDKDFFDKAGIKPPITGGGSRALVKYNPRQIAIIRAKPKNKLTAADKALLAAISGTSLIATTGAKKAEKKPVPKAPSGFKDKGSKGRGKGGVTMDDMLEKKEVRGPSKKFLQKTSKPKAKGQFGSNISFTSKDVKTLKQNAKDLKKQIDGLDITNFQKLRLKKLVDTRDPGYSMGESYNRAFNEVKRRVRDNKLNFAIDVSGYAG